MEMKSKKPNAIGEWIDSFLWRMCGAMSQDVRIIVIVSATLLFAGASIYFTVSSIYNFGKEEGQNMQIQHMEQLKPEPRLKDIPISDVELNNEFDYDNERESE